MTQRPAPEWLTAWEFAHRGLHGPGIPENSLAAAEGAIARGMGIECDIQMTLDGVPMVFHDWDLARLTGASGTVGALTAEAVGCHALIGSDQRPPRLDAFLAAIAARSPLLIEVKSLPGYDVGRSCNAVAEALSRYRGAVAVMSFDPRVPIWFKMNAPGTPRGLVGTDSHENGFDRVWRDAAVLGDAQPDFLAIDVRELARHEAAAWRSAGHPLLTWTVRSPETRAIGLAHADALIAEGEGLA